MAYRYWLFRKDMNAKIDTYRDENREDVYKYLK
jgi:hypothetical protein